MKAAEQYFPIVLFIILYKVVLTFYSVDEIFKSDHSNKMKASQQHFPMELFIMQLHKEVLTFGSVDENLKNVIVSVTIQMKAILSRTLLWCSLLSCYTWWL